MLFYTLVLLFSPLDQGTPNSDKCILCTVHCGRNVNKPSAPTEVERKGLQLWCDIAVQQKHNYIKLERILLIFGFRVNMENTIYSSSTPWALFHQKWCVAPDFFVLISSHCSTQIWRMRYGGSWSIYFLVRKTRDFRDNLETLETTWRL